MKNKRAEQIIEYMTLHNNTATVSELCNKFKVSDMTIRRDFQQLEKSKKIIRHYGGASLVQKPFSPFSADPFQTRLIKNQSLKMNIGKLGAAYLKDISETTDCNSVFLASGSTLYCMSQQIPNNLNNTTLVTDNLNVSQVLASNPQHTVILIGGQLILPSLNAVGHHAEKMIRNFKYDYAFIGAAAIDEQGYVYTYNFIEAGIFFAILESSRNIVVLADSTKTNQKTFVQLFKLKKGHTLITNSIAPIEFINTLKSNGVYVITD